jgi:hypothetical protein
MRRVVVVVMHCGVGWGGVKCVADRGMGLRKMIIGVEQLKISDGMIR